MNKLVSRNPILRFKLGKKIIKAQKGVLFWMGRMGDWYSGNKKGNTYINPTQISPEKIVPLKDGRTIAKINGKWYNQNGQKVINFGSSVPKTNNFSKIRQSVNNYADKLLNSNTTKAFTPTDNYYLKGFENRKDEIAKLGGVRAVLKMLGFTAGNGLDGKWGQNTEDAYLKYLIANTAKTPSLKDTISAAQNLPILSTPTINPSEYTFTESQLSGLGENPYYEPNPELKFNNFDRTQTRQWLRDNGFNPYSLTGALRKSLRMILNGLGTDEDKNLIGLTNGLSEILTNYKYLKQGGTMNILPSRNIIERFKLGRKITFAQNGVSFKDAWNLARANKQRYFNWNGRMYNSKAAGNDTEYESFVDNMNEMSALLPTDRQPKHLGWERNNPTSSEVRGNDREIKKDGTENTLTEIIISGKKKSKKSTPSTKIVTNKNKNKASRNMSGAWGQGSGGGQQYANLRQYAFERSAFDKMRTSSSGIFGSTAYKTDNRGRRYVERDGSLYYDDGTYYNPQTRKTGKYTYTPGGLFSRNLFTLY